MLPARNNLVINEPNQNPGKTLAAKEPTTTARQWQKQLNLLSGSRKSLGVLAGSHSESQTTQYGVSAVVYTNTLSVGFGSLINCLVIHFIGIQSEVYD